MPYFLIGAGFLAILPLSKKTFDSSGYVWSLLIDAFRVTSPFGNVD